MQQVARDPDARAGQATRALELPELAGDRLYSRRPLSQELEAGLERVAVAWAPLVHTGADRNAQEKIDAVNQERTP